MYVCITDPHTSVPPLLKCLKEYSAVSGYKLNYTKSEILPLNIQDNNRTLSDPLKWCNNGFKYLGTQIGKSDGHIFKQNYIKLLEQTNNSNDQLVIKPLQKLDNNLFIWIRCVGRGNHLKHAGQSALWTTVSKHLWVEKVFLENVLSQTWEQGCFSELMKSWLLSSSTTTQQTTQQ